MEMLIHSENPGATTINFRRGLLLHLDEIEFFFKKSLPTPPFALVSANIAANKLSDRKFLQITDSQLVLDNFHRK